ncbi:MAG: riboflavin kinase [Mycoplasma sp.]
MKSKNWEHLTDQIINQDIIIGFFDVIHKGHFQLLNNHKDATLITFDNIPHKSKPIHSLNERINALTEFGLNNIFVFDIDTNNMTAKEFTNKYLSNSSKVIVGEDFKLGSDFKSIHDFKDDIKLEIYPYLEKYSTSKIKELLMDSNIKEVNELLIKPFELTNTVSHGNKLGRELGFPTANFNYTNGQYLGSGIFMTKTLVNEKWYRSVTVSIKDKKIPSLTCDVIETHIIDFNGDLYDKEITVSFLEHIGNMQKTNNIEELKAVIKGYIDIVSKRTCF